MASPSFFPSWTSFLFLLRLPRHPTSRLLASLLCLLQTTCLQMLCHRVPLVKKKSLRKNLKEHGLLKDFLKNHSPNPASKYFPQEAAVMATQPLENYMDVSARGRPRRKGGLPGVLEDGPGPPGRNPGGCSQALRGTGGAGKLTIRAVALICSFVHSSSVFAHRAPPFCARHRAGPKGSGHEQNQAQPPPSCSSRSRRERQTAIRETHKPGKAQPGQGLHTKGLTLRGCGRSKQRRKSQGFQGTGERPRG